MTKTMISKLCYELYKADWKRRHVTADIEWDSIKNYQGLIELCDDTDYTYEDYVSEFGYNGELYVCYEEFLEEEYYDVFYMTGLLKGNDNLTEMYLGDYLTR